MLFEKKVSARKFASTKVDVFYGVEAVAGIKVGDEKVPLPYVVA